MYAYMPAKIERDEVRRLVELGAQLVEVLDADEFELEHLPGAINIPLREFDRRAPAELDRSRPVVLYCNDFL